MQSESVFIADQLRRAFLGDAWHGPSVRELLTGVTAVQAAARPLSSTHSIWELVLHMDAWIELSRQATEGIAMPQPAPAEVDWPPAGEGAAAWANNPLVPNAMRLAEIIETFSAERLRETVPGRDFNFAFLFHGVVQHSLYHAGQIAMLKKAALEP